MKSLLNLFFVILFICLMGCFPTEEEVVILSFWTDKPTEIDCLKKVFVNEEYIGELSQDLVDPNCTEPELLNYTMTKAEDLHISVRNDDGESIDIGIVNLYSVSTGIKIKPTKNSEIFVDHELDTECTLVYLSWN
ncbi:MAG: hypothetical protein AAGA77_15135 [Bacteroidota bacterium]